MGQDTQSQPFKQLNTSGYRLITQDDVYSINICSTLQLWESMYNPNFKPLEFEGFRKRALLHSFVMTPKKWIERTNAIGNTSKLERYEGTFPHMDIAFEFASWISIEFKLFIIKEFQCLKTDESDRLKLNWNLQLTLAKVNYHIENKMFNKFQSNTC